MLHALADLHDGAGRLVANDHGLVDDEPADVTLQQDAAECVKSSRKCEKSDAECLASWRRIRESHKLPLHPPQSLPHACRVFNIIVFMRWSSSPFAGSARRSGRCPQP